MIRKVILSEEEAWQLDERIYGVSFVKDGRRVPPWEVSFDGLGHPFRPPSFVHGITDYAPHDGKPVGS